MAPEVLMNEGEIAHGTDLVESEATLFTCS